MDTRERFELPNFRPVLGGLSSRVFLLLGVLAWGGSPRLQAVQALAPAQDAPPARPAQTSDQLQQLVAPIALYPDALVAQILAAATFPEQVVQADRWLQAHPELTGDALARAADLQAWDPSVKALTAFPSVLGNMDRNLAWTSSLGDAYYNQPQDVTDAVQTMRRKAKDAGNLRNSAQQEVGGQDGMITIEPTDPDVIYLPAYDPWIVYGVPLVAWPGWYPYPGLWYDGPYLTFGLGCRISFFRGYGWGCTRWGFDWRNRVVIYNRSRYVSASPTFFNRSALYRGGAGRGGLGSGRGQARSGDFQPGGGRDQAEARPFAGNAQAARGYGEPHGQAGVHTGAFSSYDHGGQTRGFASRGSASLGGGGARGGGAPSGGGAHGGGGSHGGGHR